MNRLERESEMKNNLEIARDQFRILIFNYSGVFLSRNKSQENSENQALKEKILVANAYFLPSLADYFEKEEKQIIFHLKSVHLTYGKQSFQTFVDKFSANRSL